MGELYDAPNQQVVRGDGSGPGDEGSGGSPVGVQPSAYEGLTKDELLDEADALGLDVPASATKAEIRAALEGASEA